MRTKGLFLAAFVAFLFMGTQSALAQTRTADMNLTVTANNVGIFTCSLGTATFDFGDVDADPTPSSTGVPATRNVADDGSYYDALAATTWSCRAAPSSTVAIALTSVATDHTPTGAGLGDDGLQVGISGASSGTSTGLQNFTSGNDLITGVSVGNGGAAADGDLDLRLHVLDSSPTGANTWVVNLRATGSP